MESNLKENLLILAVVGMPGTGKSEVLKNLIKKYDFYHLYYGGITIDEVKRRGLEITEANEKTVREDMRKSGDMGIYSRFMIPKIEDAIKNGHTKIILESMYNVQEYEIIKEKYKNNFKVLAIHTDRDLRIKRLNVRKERKLTEEELDSREVSEAKKLWKGTLIAMADYHYVNQGDQMDVFENDLDIFINEKILNNDLRIKNFENWSGKKRITERRERLLLKTGGIYWCYFGQNVGNEEDGKGENYKRPVLVLKKYSKEICFVLPLTSTEKKGSWFFDIGVVNAIKAQVILSQGKTIDIKRLDQFILQISEKKLQKIKDEFLKLINKTA